MLSDSTWVLFTTNRLSKYISTRKWLSLKTLQWRHNERDGVSNHQPHDCFLNRLFRRRSKKTSKLRFTGPCAGKSPVNSPHKGPVTRKMFPFDDVIMWIQNKDSFHWRWFHCNQNSMGISLDYHMDSNAVIVTIFCAWQGSCACVACANICCDLMSSNILNYSKGNIPSNLNFEQNRYWNGP